jgi:DNA mismatch repair protein MutL
MTIAILPARLANQIAAGEVVERPASVIKELVENSLDAGATAIHIDVDKGGVKKIRISDNGSGIDKDELTLALSRHATSKIKDLNDLEAINSLGFRGEALASISSVARLTLTSKPKSQPTAWQAIAEGRDMAVAIKPAAHPDGTTIEVLDLFFNTPARRKFLRTEKTEFNHIDEVVRRIALARFDVSFSLTHNGKMIRQYRAANTQEQNAKRVAMVCGKVFVENAIEVDCQHDDMHFSGWLAKPNFARNQNDLCYSYVNGRMMRDKLINHAIRQAYSDLLPPDTYPAFVLFLTLDHREVDVNVHPAKHEVRFHQSRYVHDFIYSVCHQALMDQNEELSINEEQKIVSDNASVSYERPDYVTPLQQVSDVGYTPKQSYANSSHHTFKSTQSPSALASTNYQQLMTPAHESIHIQETQTSTTEVNTGVISNKFFYTIVEGMYGVFKHENKLKLMSLVQLGFEVNREQINQNWQQGELGLISQPLLLPLLIKLTESQVVIVKKNQVLLERAGIFVEIKNKQQIKIRQYPALLRENDVNSSFNTIVNEMMKLTGINEDVIDNEALILILAQILAEKILDESQAQTLWLSAQNTLSEELIQKILLKSSPIDLTSSIKQLESHR